MKNFDLNWFAIRGLLKIRRNKLLCIGVVFCAVLIVQMIAKSA